MTYSWVPEEEPSFGEEALEFGKGAVRQGARTVSNIATLGVGLPGDIFSLINDYIANPATEALGGKSVPYEETFLGKALPTTETHRERIGKASGGYLEPQNEVEMFGDEVVDLAATITSPKKLIKKGITAAAPGASKLVQSMKYIGKNIAKGMASSVIGRGTEELTGDPRYGGYAKLASIFTLSLFDKKKAGQLAGELYKQTESSLPIGATGNATKLANNTDSVINQVMKGRPYNVLSGAEKFVVDQAVNVKSLIQNGQIPIEQAWAQKKTIFQNTSKLWEESKNYDAVKNAKRQANQLSHYLDQSIKEYGKAQNPEFLKNYTQANEVFGAIADTSWLTKAGETLAKYSPVTKGLSALVGIPIAATATVTGAIPTAKVLFRIYKSPTLTKLYGQNLKAAGEGNAVVFNRTLKEIDEKLQEEESKDRYSFVED